MKHPIGAAAVILPLIIVCLFAWFFSGDILWDRLQLQRSALATLVERLPLAMGGIFLLVYTALAAFFMPVCLVLTLTEGAVFGFSLGFL